MKATTIEEAKSLARAKSLEKGTKMKAYLSFTVIAITATL